MTRVPVGRVKVIGVGMGDPEHLTGQAVRALNSVDVFFVLEKGSAADELAALRHELCRQVIASHPYRFADLEDPRRDRTAPDYDRAVGDWTDARAGVLAEAIRREVGEGECAGLLAWGDPAFYDSTLRVLSSPALDGSRLDVEVVPGLSSVQLLAAAHRISLTRVGRPVQLMTGRQLAVDGLPAGCDDVVVMLDGGCSFRQVDPVGLTIYWGAQLGRPDQVLVAGDLATVADRIVEARGEAKARRGWVMDTYLLRRSRPPEPDRPRQAPVEP